MPVFEYRCLRCDATLEVIVLPTEEAPKACPACGGDLRKCYGRVGVQLVGWDFARNDALLPAHRRRGSYKRIRDKAAELFD